LQKNIPVFRVWRLELFLLAFACHLNSPLDFPVRELNQLAVNLPGTPVKSSVASKFRSGFMTVDFAPCQSVPEFVATIFQHLHQVAIIRHDCG
jgi:hypothetical protein